MALIEEPGSTTPEEVSTLPLVTAHTIVTTLLCILYAIMYLDRVNISAAAASIKLHFALTNFQMGLTFSAFSWAYLASVFLGGWGARTYGARATLVACVVLVGIGTIATGLAGSLVALVGARLAVGFGEGPAFPAGTQAMRNWYPPHRFGTIQGITHSASRLGAALAPPIVTALILWWNWRISFVICGSAALIWATAWWFLFQDDPRTHSLIDPQRVEGLSVSLANRRAKTPLWILTKRMFPVTIVMFAYGWTYWMFIAWLPLYFANQHGTNLKNSSLLTSVLFFGGLVGNTVGGVVSDRVLMITGRNRLARCSVILVSLVGAAAMILPTMFLDSLPIVVPLLAGAMFFLELTIAPIYAATMDISKDYAGLASAYVIMGIGISGVISPVVFGWLIDLTGNWNVPFATGIVILLLGAGAVIMLRPDIPLVVPEDGNVPAVWS